MSIFLQIRAFKASSSDDANTISVGVVSERVVEIKLLLKLSIEKTLVVVLLIVDVLILVSPLISFNLEFSS